MVRIKNIWVVLMVLFCSSGFSQNLVKSSFDKANLTYTFTFQNEYNYPIYVIKVGAIGQINFGDLRCPPSKWVPDPIADYTVFLPPVSDTVFINTVPVKTIYPRQTVTFSVAIIPPVASACDAWAIDVSALVKFHFGYTFQSSAELVMSQDIESLAVNPYSDQELISMINSSDPTGKVDAIRKLKFSGMDKQILANHLRARLKDRDIHVRIAATLAIKDLKISTLNDELISNLFSSTEYEERLILIQVFGKMKDPALVDPLISRILNGDTVEAGLASKSLIDMNLVEVCNKVRFLLQKHEIWAGGSAVEKNKLLNLTRIVIRYRDMASIPIIKKLLVSQASAIDIKHNLLMDIASLIEKYQVVKDAFVISFRDLIVSFLNNKDDFVRYNALNLYCASDAETKEKSKVIRKALKDTEYHIQCRAAVWAGELGFSEFVGDMQVMCQAAEGPEYTEICEALIKLNAGKN
ncbi:MAG: hypothetical protein JXA03_14665 [Bacteroidales bacterium]|nr:hypothetical protein [Bacteroidales bacterium]